MSSTSKYNTGYQYGDEIINVKKEIGGAEFDATTIYIEGDKVLHNGVRYVRKSWGADTPAAEAWTAAHWEAEDPILDRIDLLTGRMDAVTNLIYPVGSIYMSVNDTSPAVLFGGTWSRLKSRFLIGTDDEGDPTATYDYPAGDTGGADSVSYTPAGIVGAHTLTVDEIPSHNHSFTGSAVTSGGQNQSHTHTGTSGNVSAGHTHSGPSHTHGLGGSVFVGSGSGAYGPDTSAGSKWDTKSAGTGATGGQSANHTHTTTTGNASQGHTHSVTASGSIGNQGGGLSHDHGFTGTAATISTMPPYLAVYMWERTA